MKSIEIQAPNEAPSSSLFSIFLAGSIEMGNAEKWQDSFVKRYPDNVLFLNPRRADWDSTWTQDSDQFNEQVNWELDMLEQADIIALYFDPKTQSPISLLELGLHAGHRKVIVCCPDGFWRQGNVRIVCERNIIPFFTDKEKWLEYFDTIISNL